MADKQSTTMPASSDETKESGAREAGARSGKKNAGNRNAKKKRGPAARRSTGAIPLLKEQHGEIRRLISAGIDDPEEFARVWSPHTIIEEEILVPAAEESGVDAEFLAQSGVERDLVKVLLRDLLVDTDPFSAAAKRKVLGIRALQLIETEEKPRQGLVALAKAAGVDLAEIQRRAVERNEQLKALAERRSINVPAPRSLRIWGGRQRDYSEENEKMPRQSMRERDDQGRFTSEDDDYGRRGGGSQSRSNDRDRDSQGRFRSDDDDGGYRGRSSSGNDRDRDDRGRFMSEDEGYSSRSRSGGGRGRSDDDDDRGGRRSSASRRNDDDDDRRSSSGRGGWFGDSEGHSEASRRGWENSDHRDSGWFGDSEGHSEASRRGWRNSDHGDSGWYGDREGHSEASRRGWEGRRSGSSRNDDDRNGGGRNSSRSSSYDDDRRSSRSDDDRRSSRGDDDRRSSRGDEDRRSSRSDDDDRSSSRGHGGWFGDSEGHSEASRRGWSRR